MADEAHRSEDQGAAADLGAGGGQGHDSHDGSGPGHPGHGGNDPDHGGNDPPDHGGHDPPDHGGNDPSDHGGHDHSDHGGHDPSDHGGHDHSSHSSRTLAVVAIINLVGFVAELVGGLTFGSVALLSDAVHMLFDALAYVMAWAASYVAGHHTGSERWSFGLHRLEPLSAFLNGALLLPMVAFILWESYQRFLDPIGIGTGPTLAIAVGGLVVNLVSVWILEDGEMSLNERGAFYHLLGDAGGSVAVIVSTVVVGYTDLVWLDPLTAGLIAVLVVWSAGKLLRGSGAIFLGRSPVDPGRLRGAIADVEGVTGVIDLHAWQICSELTVATAHVATSSRSMADAAELNRRVHAVLGDHGVDHATVELCPPESDPGDRLDAHGH